MSSSPENKRKADRLRLVRTGAPDFPAFPEAASSGLSFGLPFSAAGRRYYPLVGPAPAADFSFALVDGDGPAAAVQCDGTNAQALTRFGSPIEIWQRDGLAGERQRRVVREVLGELTRLATAAGTGEIRLRTNGATDPAGAYAGRLLDIGAAPAPAFRARFDLSETQDALLEDMRQGHRQQVRWGMKNLRIATVDAASPDAERFEAFRELHQQVAGRATRERASWDAMFALIAEGEGDLVLCEFEGELVGGTLVLDAGDWSYYASGAYRRDRMDKPLSHYPLFLAAERARTRGRRWFDIGETVGAGSMTEKDRQIGRFKSGFTARSQASLVWTVEVESSGERRE